MSRELEQAPATDSSPAHVAAALHRACALVAQNLRESMGDDGCDALFARAIARSEALDPVVGHLRAAPESGISREGLSDAVKADGDAARASVEAVLAAIIEILARLIGEDMALRIIDRDTRRDSPPPDPNGARS